MKWAGIHAPTAHLAIILHTRLAFNDLFPHMKIYPEYSAKFSLELSLYQDKYALWWGSCDWGIYDLFNEKFLICYVKFLFYIKWTLYKYESWEVPKLTLENEAIDLSWNTGQMQPMTDSEEEALTCANSWPITTNLNPSHQF